MVTRAVHYVCFLRFVSLDSVMGESHENARRELGAWSHNVMCLYGACLVHIADVGGNKYVAYIDLKSM